ncbi:hypothetical protein [uncultured Oscillibacter sp.]|nr:hypothetical protein [uncultured Oscillibacter sp.]
MDAMVTFSVTFLGAVADFLAAEPVIYLVSLCLLCFVAKLMKIFLP